MPNCLLIQRCVRCLITSSAPPPVQWSCPDSCSRQWKQSPGGDHRSHCWDPSRPGWHCAAPAPPASPPPPQPPTCRRAPSSAVAILSTLAGLRAWCACSTAAALAPLHRELPWTSIATHWWSALCEAECFDCHAAMHRVRRGLHTWTHIYTWTLTLV